jgi:AmiR/NasT family two-component response regulator
MEPHVVAGTSPRDGVDTVFGASGDADEQLTPVETYLLEALERLDAAESRALQLEAALAHSRDIGAAIGILMALRRVTREQAFDELRQASMARNVKLHVLALEVVETGLLGRS